MSNVGSVSSSNLYNVPNLGTSDQYLSADALITQLQAQMSSLDGDLKNLTTQQQNDITAKKVIQDARQAGNKYTPPADQAQWDENISGMRQAADALPPGDPTRNLIYEQIDKIQHQYCNGLSKNPHYPSREEWESSMQGFKDDLDNINGNAELRMISIQDLVSKRQTAVQLTTSIMQKLNETTASITQKI